MNKELARQLRVRQITRSLLIKYSNIPAYKSAEIYFDNKGNIIEVFNYRRIPSHEIRIEVADWKKFIYDANDHLVKVVDAKNDIEMEVNAVNGYTINTIKSRRLSGNILIWSLMCCVFIARKYRRLMH